MISRESMSKPIYVFDFDGTFYETPTTDIPKLEDAIDLAMLKLFRDKLEKAPNRADVLRKLDTKYEKMDKSEVCANIHNQNGGKAGGRAKYVSSSLKFKLASFSDLLRGRAGKGSKSELIVARLLAKMMEPDGVGNHRVSGMLNLGLDISQEEIEHYYKEYATIKYRNIKRNKLVEKVFDKAKKDGCLVFIYTDNSKNNVYSGMRTLGYEDKEVLRVFDMFDCDGGATKKTKRGVDAFKCHIGEYCRMKGVDFDVKDIIFFDDNKNICNFMQSQGIRSFHVEPDEVKAVKDVSIINRSFNRCSA